MLRLWLLITLCANVAGCAALQQDRRDAPWDPRAGSSMIDQIPNWEGSANKICCGHLRSCKEGQTPRC